MSSRKQERMARIIKEAVSDAIQNRLNDPRLAGFTSVTEVKVSPDLRNSDVFLSIMGTTDAGRHKTFAAIVHATKYIQELVGRRLRSKFCPTLHFHEDDRLKKTLKTMEIIDEVAREFKETDSRESADSDQ